MKNVILILVFIMLFVSSASAADEYIPGWIDNSKDPLGVLEYTAGIVEKDGRQSVLKLEMLSQRADNTIVSFRQYLDGSLLQEGHTYRLELDIKAEAPSPTWVCVRFGTEYKDMSEPYTPHITQWQHRSMSYTVTDLSKQHFVELQCQHNTVAFYADSLMVYDEADENKTNILLNGDFDEENDKLKLHNIRAERSGENTLLSWDAPSELIRDVRLYDASDMSEIEIEENCAQLGSEPPGELIFEIEDIYGGFREQRKYLAAGFEGDFSVPDISREDGKIKAAVGIANEVEQAAVVMAVYRDGRLIGSTHVWRKAADGGSADEVTLFYTPEECGVYGVKLFLFDSLSGLRPLCDAAYREIEII